MFGFFRSTKIRYKNDSRPANQSRSSDKKGTVHYRYFAKDGNGFGATVKQYYNPSRAAKARKLERQGKVEIIEISET